MTQSGKGVVAVMETLCLEGHHEELLGRELAAQALEGGQQPRARVRLSPEVQPWLVLDPHLFEDSPVQGYRPRVKVWVVRHDLRRSPRVLAPTDHAPALDATTDHATTDRASGPDQATASDHATVSGKGTASGKGRPEDKGDPQSRAERERMAATAHVRFGLRSLGLDEAMIDSLADLAQACATVSGTQPGDRNDHHNDDPHDDRDDASAEASGSEAPGLVARGQLLVDAVETLTGIAGRLDAVLLSATRQLTGVNSGLLLADKSASSPDDLTT